mmetsp:Transcript_39452/g.45304  ORF Transcript_39452/g.45304 Transcript_39452/m.45304 type:complete len:297 (-) Transcript_39452:201-1091(-)
MEAKEPLISLFEKTNSYVVYILGTTASGKSQLALDLAVKYDGVIINADSMQVYKDFGIITAKPSAEERKQVPHRLFDYVDIGNTDYSVAKWQEDVFDAISQVLEDGQLPIVCGGTCNYIKSLLFENFTSTPEDGNEPISNEELISRIETATAYQNTDQDESSDNVSKLHQYLYEKYWGCEVGDHKDEAKDKQDEKDLFSSKASYKLLSIVDPEMTSYVPEKDNRRIFNALRKYYKSEGKIKESDIKFRQNIRLRFPSLIIRLKADQEILNQRISKRIDQMLFNKELKSDGTYTNGI